jgi:hypothetical protein
MKSLNDTSIRRSLPVLSKKTNSEIKKSVSILSNSVDYKNILKFNAEIF